MKRTIALFTFLVIYFTVQDGSADSRQFWGFDLPVFENAQNLVAENNDRFLSMMKSYDIKIDSPDKIRNFYSAFFESFGWENPMKAFKQEKMAIQNGWSAYRMAFNNEGKPEAIYAVTWKGKDKPGTGTLQVKLTDYTNGIFTAFIEVKVTPDIDMSPLFKLNELIGNDPKNLFLLYQATDGNPFEIDSIGPVCEGDLSGSDSLVKDYCTIVNGILENFLKYKEVNTK